MLAASLAGVDTHWQGAAAILIGVVALCLGIRNLRGPDPTTPGAVARDPAGPYTAEDFPCPDPTPGGKQHNAAYSGWLDPAPEGDEIAFAVVVPKGSSGEAELKAIGEQLQQWKSANDFVRDILGIEQLLRGEFPETPAYLFWLPIPPATEKVALVYVTLSANTEQTGASLSQALDGLSVAMVVSPAYYSQINR
jgi:hypothetical protein